MRKFWNKFVTLLGKVGTDKWYHFIAGVLASAFACIVLGITWCIAAAIVAGVAKEVFDILTTKQYEISDVLWTCIGGAIIQVFALL